MTEIEKQPLEKREVNEVIVIGGETFTHVRTRVYSPVSVYKGSKSILRIGPHNVLTPELTLHKKLSTFGFPVSEILAEGELQGKKYYIETSLGDVLLGSQFAEDVSSRGTISDERFLQYESLTKKFAEAQLKTAEKTSSFEEFSKGIHADEIIEELPALQGKIELALEKLKQRVAGLPTMLTHGDLNPHNLFEGGVIDFGSSLRGPAGYDLIANLFHIYNFPSGTEEQVNARKYTFTRTQRHQYLSVIDDIYEQNHLSKPSEHTDDFIFARTIWSVVRMGRLPELQTWRYAQFEKILEAYMKGQDLAELVTKE